MAVNNNCSIGNYSNETNRCLDPSSSHGQVWGLTLFFLLLVIVAGVIMYKYHSKIMLPFGRTRSQKKEDFTEPAHVDSHQYTSMTEHSIGQTPIYENLTTQTTGYNRRSESRLSSQHEEDLYLQCDIPDDAIYSNDPACNLSILPDYQEEDVYIMPDS